MSWKKTFAFLDTSVLSHCEHWVYSWGSLFDALLALVSLGRVVSHIGSKLYEWVRRNDEEG